MQRVQLVEELKKAGVASSLYHIEDVDGPFTGDGYEPARRGEQWRVSYYERGQETWGQSYVTESDACRAFADELARSTTPPSGRPLTPEESARAEKIAEVKRAKHRAFLAEHGMLDQ